MNKENLTDVKTLLLKNVSGYSSVFLLLETIISLVIDNREVGWTIHSMYTKQLHRLVNQWV